jgi:predicted transcriptional regulator
MPESKRILPKPTDAEMEVLNVLWKFGPSTVRSVNDELSRNKEVGYTTTLKIMQIMFEKGLVRRDQQGRTHIYEPLLTEAEVQEKVLDKLLQTTFGGSAKNLVMRVLGQNRSSREELEEIKKLIDKLESEQS